MHIAYCKTPIGQHIGKQTILSPVDRIFGITN